MFTQWKKVAAILSTAALLSVGAGTALAQDHGHSHDAGHDTRGPGAAYPQ